MVRILAVLAAIVLVTPIAPAAPTLKGKEAYYHPTTEGDKRVYETRDGDQIRETWDVVMKVEKKDDALIVTVGREVKGELRAVNKVEVSDKGVTHLTSGPFPLKTPRPAVKLPAKPGEKWSYESDGSDGPVGSKATHTVGKEEEVEVPAGKFKAIRVDSDRTLPTATGEIKVRASYWYAPNVGLVKSVTSSGGRDTVRILKSFNSGK
jgi:hypothetical protein